MAPEVLSQLFAINAPQRRHDEERRCLGIEAASLGRELAERWELDPLVADSAWLHADATADLQDCSCHPARLALIQKAPTPGQSGPPGPCSIRRNTIKPVPDPRLQSIGRRGPGPLRARLCGRRFLDPRRKASRGRMPDCWARTMTPRTSGRFTRSYFLVAFSTPLAGDPPSTWANTVARAWCDEPGVTAARVVLPSSMNEEPSPRPPSEVRHLGLPGSPTARLLLWTDPEGSCRQFHLPTPLENRLEYVGP